MDIADAAATLTTAAHVFICHSDSIDDAALLAQYEALLDATERARFVRFHFDRDARTFLVAHALVRDALSRFAHVAPHEWRFRTNDFGRPEIDQPAAGRLRFNLSHSRGMIACLVAADVEPGIDVEEIRPSDDLADLAERYFSPAEVAGLRACPREDVADRFFALWTLKESYIKARGLGLSLPLDKFSFSFRGDRLAVHFEPEMADRAEDWAFTLARPSPSHFVAVALRRKPGAQPRQLFFQQFVPLKPDQSFNTRYFNTASNSSDA